MTEPRTKAGRHYVATMFGRERSDVFDVTQTEAKMKAAIRRIEDEASRDTATARIAAAAKAYLRLSKPFEGFVAAEAEVNLRAVLSGETRTDGETT